MREAHRSHAYAPKDHNHGYEDAGSEALEHDVCQGFEEGVGDEEEGEGGVILGAVTGKVEVFGEIGKFGVADVCSCRDGC